MSNYIGNQPSAGEFKKLDSIASSFNGSLTQFDLDYSTVNQSVGDATQLIVSLNGIIQEPGIAYTLGIGGGSIVFASAPASGDTCHIVLLGGVGGTTTPTDGSVTASKLDSSLKDYLEETFTANGSQTVFTLTRAVVGANTLLVTIDGIVQPSSAFTASGTTLTISEVLAANTNVRVVHMGVKAGIYVPANDSVTADMLANSINTDIAAGVAALPKAGGTMTGVIAGFESTGIDDNATDTVVTVQQNGMVGIGIDGPGARLTLGGTAGAADNSSVMLISLGATQKTYFGTANATGNIITGSSSGDTVLRSNGHNILFSVDSGASEAMRINSSGSLLVGKQAEEGNDVGAELRSNGSVIATVNNTLPMFINRKSSGAELVRFAFDNATIGNIGSKLANSQYRLYLGNSNTKILFDNGADRIYPVNNDGNARNGAIDLGLQGAAFKDLYLTGGVDFGGSVNSGGTVSSSNKLDDYEEGTWTPVIKVGTTTNSGTLGNARYIKIGGMVTAYLEVYSITKSGTGNLEVHGLPYACGSNSRYGIPFATRFGGIGGGFPVPLIQASSTVFQIQRFDTGSNGYAGAVTHSQLDSTYNLYTLGMTYFTN